MMNNNYNSSEINLIMGALAKAQGTYNTLIPNEDAPGGRFANLQAILDSVRESLSSNGLAFYQQIELQDDGAGAALLKTRLGHESGQYIGSCGRVVSAPTLRSEGNNLEHHKRLHALLILGIAPSKNDPSFIDDNGEEQSDDHMVKTYSKPKISRKVDKDDTISKDQYTNLIDELEGYEELVKQILDLFNIATLADLPKEEYHKVLGKVRRVRKESERHIIT